MKKQLLLFMCLLFAAGLSAQQNFTTFQNAANVMGPPTFNTAAFSCSQAGLRGPIAIAVSSQGMVAVAESAGARVKIWKSLIAANAAPADVVLGKVNFTTCGALENDFPTATSLSNCQGIAFSPDGNKVIVSDYNRNRIMIWNSIPTTNAQAADVVLGQPTFQFGSLNNGSSGLYGPTGLTVTPDGKLLAIDYNHQRILVWNSIPTTNNAPADVVIGQDDFFASTTGTAFNKINKPFNIQATADGKLLVADTYNHRILIFNSIPTTNGASADLVIGQTGADLATQGLSDSKFSFPTDCAVAPDGKLAVSDYSNSRVLLFNAIPTTNGAAADLVLGQPNFTSSAVYNPTGFPGVNNMRAPYSCEFDASGRLFVTGTDMNRVMIFGYPEPGTADITLSANQIVGTHCAGNDVALTFTVTNNGPDAATGVTIKTTLAESLFLTNTVASVGTFNPETKIWTLPSIPSGTNATLTFSGYATLTGTFDTDAVVQSYYKFDPTINDHIVPLTYTVANVFAGPALGGSLTRCANATVASLSADPTIKWYATQAGGSQIPAGTLLTTADYFATQTVASCESLVRIKVSVTLDNSAFCNTATYQDYQAADLVIGQSGFNTSFASCTAAGANGTTYVAVSSKGVLAIAEQVGGRVKIWKNQYVANGTPADVVIGKPNFTSCNSNSAPTQSITGNCDGVAFSPDGNKLLVSDAGNNRVLIWNSIPTTNGQPADVVLGQTSFTTGTAGTSASSLSYPNGIFVAQDGKLFVTDFNNNRVLIWNSIPLTNGKPADVVVGQPDFLTNTNDNTAGKMNEPWGVWVSPDGKLLVADTANNRIMIWNTVPTSNGQLADVVVGQTDFGISDSGTAADKLFTPAGVTISTSGAMAIGDFNNRRVVLYDSIPTTNGASADHVLGQADFSTNIEFFPSGGPDNRNMNFPYNVSFDLNGRLFVVGRNMNRGMIFGKLPAEQAELSIAIAGDDEMLCLGNTSTLTITLKNNSSIEASGVIAAASLPNPVSFSSHTASAGSYSVASGQWNIGTIPAGATVTLTLNGLAGIAGDYTASASILHSNQFDPNMENNGDSVVFIIGDPLALAYSGSNPISFCEGIRVIDFIQGDTSLKLFTSLTGGTPLTLNTVLQTGTYFVTRSAGCTTIDRIPVAITIVPYPVAANVNNITACDSYTLPVLADGKYFTAAGGTGTMLNAGDSITTNQTIYVFYETGTLPNCTNEVSFTIAINVFCNTAAFYLPDSICEGEDLNFLPYDDNGNTGTWSPAPNNMETTTYTWIPNNDGSVYPYVKTITVNPILEPEFDQVAAVCPGGNIYLPSTSNNGISGDWSPQINDMETTTYTFTPYSWMCGTQTTMTVEVGAAVPTFDAVADICAGVVLSPLPTTSNNGIVGTWSPSLNNTETTTYTFTPTDGSCAQTTTLTITVGNAITPTFNAVAAICVGGTLSALPTLSLNGISGTWSPALNNLETTTYTFTPDDTCALSTTLSITVNPNVTPTFNTVAAICSGGNLSALPTTSLNGIVGTWSPVLNNQTTTTYTFTPNANQCSVTTTMSIAVNPNATPTFNTVAAICSGGNLSALPTTSLNGIVGTWSPALNNQTTTTYTFTPNANQCSVTTTMSITVNSNVTPTFNTVAAICAGGNLSALPTTSLNGIVGTWSPALNNLETTTYTFTPDDTCALSTTLSITVNLNVTPTFNTVAAICSGGNLSALPATSLNGISGTWSPALNNLATTTYTFTPNANQCSVATTMSIAVNPNVTPTFNTVAAICAGGNLSALPTTSLNGIVGTWSPALNNLATTTYTFTPNANQCSVSTTMSITVNSNVTPTFNTVAAICSGGNLSALPTLSLNGISGTWSPALNNLETTTYTFTPDDTCALPTTLSITVNPNVTPTFNTIAAICSGGNLSALPTTSLNGIVGTWSPALNNLATTTYTFTPNANQCSVTTTMSIAVNPNATPTFNTVAAICSGGNLSALPTTSLNGIVGTWSPVLNNLATTTYTFTPNSNQCSVTTTMSITVNSNVTPTFNTVAAICAGGTLSALPTTSLNGIVGTWSPVLNNLATTTYTFTPNANQCSVATTMTITVNSNVTPTFNAVAAICVGGTLSALPTTSLNGISGTWSPVLNNQTTTTYTFTPNANQCSVTTTMSIAVNPNVTPTFNAVVAICAGGTLSALPTTSLNGISGTWSPVLNNQTTTTYTFTPNSNQCSVATTMSIAVNPNVTPTFNTVAAICAGGNLSALPTTSLNGIVGTWSPALNNLATTTYTFTPNSNQCSVATTMSIAVNPNVTPTFNTVAAICSGENLSALPTTSLNGISGTWSPALNNLATTTYTFTPNANQCSVSTTMSITVNSNVTPTFNTIAAICAGENLSALPTTSLNGISGTWSPALNNLATTTYTFTPNANQCSVSTTMSITVNSNVTPTFNTVAAICAGGTLSALPTTSLNGIVGTWSPALNNQTTTTYTFTPNANQCSVSTTMSITVNSNATPTFNTVAAICAGGNLSALPTTSLNGIVGTWSPALNNLATTTYTFTPSSNQCSVSTTMTIDVNTIDDAVILNNATITAVAGADSYTWFDCTTNLPIANQTANTFTATQNGSYRVVIGLGNCSVTSDCVIIDNLSIDDHKTGTFTIYPNPTSAVLYWQAPANTDIDRVVIFDITGKMMIEKQSKISEINVERLEAGVYIIHAYSGSKLFQQKFIKE